GPWPRNGLVPLVSSGGVLSRSNISTSGGRGSGGGAPNRGAMPRGRSSRSRSFPNSAIAVLEHLSAGRVDFVSPANAGASDRAFSTFRAAQDRTEGLIPAGRGR